MRALLLLGVLAFAYCGCASPKLSAKSEAELATHAAKLAGCKANSEVAYRLNGGPDGGREAGIAAWENCKDAEGTR